jgi:prepilin-type N-terminal cleavage/methylation domain-containing protein
MITSRTTRRGMTMIELLVVIGLILILASLALLISPRLAEDQRSVRTSDLVSGWLLTCKQRAYRDQQTRGVRLLPTNGGTECRELQFIERPEDFRGGKLQVPSPFASGSVPPGYESATAFVHGKDLTNNKASDPTAEQIVDVGDYLVFDSLETIPYNSHRVYSLVYAPPSQQAPAGGTHIVCATFDGSRYSIINGGIPISPTGTGASGSDQFRFVRQPRPLAGEPTLQLPRDMIIDLQLSQGEGGSFLYGTQTGAIDQFDILFSPRGQLQGSNSTPGKVVLRVRNATRGARDGDQLLIVVYSRSGIIAAHPVNLTTDAVGNLVDPYGFLRDGESSGF